MDDISPLINDKFIKKYIVEFDDGSDWTLSKCLTHANRTSNSIFINIVRSGVQVSNGLLDHLKVRSKIPYNWYKEIVVSL